jgi:hypothetical protein
MEYHMLYVLGTKNFEVYNGKNLNICRVPAKCTRQNKLCRVPAKNTRWRFGFAECLTTGTRQTITAVSRFDGWRTRRPRAQMLPSACPAELGKGILCRVLDFCRVLELGKNGMYRVRNLCRVPGARHSAKNRALGIYAVSGSVVVVVFHWSCSQCKLPWCGFLLA